MKNILAVIGLLLILGSARAEGYGEHEEWAYKTRSREEASTVVINAIDPDPELGQVFHISILRVEVKNPHAAGGVLKNLPYFAVSKETLDKSLTKLVGTRYPYPKFIKGYVAWRKDRETRRAKVLTISVAELVELRKVCKSPSPTCSAPA